METLHHLLGHRQQAHLAVMLGLTPTPEKFMFTMIHSG
jgi:hypothetical protein